MDVKIVADQGTHLLIGHGNKFTVVERRNNRLYNCHGGKREGIPLDQLAEIGTLLDPGDWKDEPAARAAFEDIVARGTRINETLR